MSKVHGKHTLTVSAILAVALAAAGPSLAQPHEGDVLIGWTDFGVAGGPRHLMGEFDEFGVAQPLPAVSGLLVGWAGDEPGFEALDANEPDENFYTLPAGAIVAIEILALDEGLRVWRPGLAGMLDIGAVFPLGGDDFHAHVVWHIDSTVPGVDPALQAYGVTFRFVDVGTTGLNPSEAYTLTFVPEPASLLLLAAAGCVLRGRR